MEIFTDIRTTTTRSRKKIGFTDKKQQWQNSPALFDEHTLQINGHPVMEDWEDNYMKDLAYIAARPRGFVLEVGFGMGISANYIQDKSVAKHIIIEANHDVFLRLLEFCKTHPNVIPLYGLWEDVLPILGSRSIDGILFDTYPLCEEEIHSNHFPFFKEAYRVLKKDGVLTYYSDEIDSFSPRHRNLLHEAGFIKIESTICHVTPPKDCQYWTSRQILSPIITK